MKIALCISGQPRSFEKGFSYLEKNLLSDNDVDIFIHTWNYDFIDYNKLIELYQPKSIIIEKTLNSNLQRGVRYAPYNLYSSLYGILRSKELSNNNSIINKIKYDWKIRTRFDYAFNFKFDFNIDSKKIYVPKSIRNDIFNDQFCISGTDNFDVYCNSVLKFDELSEKYGLSGENILSGNIKENLLWDNVEFLDFVEEFSAGNYDCVSNNLIRDDFNFWVDK